MPAGGPANRKEGRRKRRERKRDRDRDGKRRKRERDPSEAVKGTLHILEGQKQGERGKREKTREAKWKGRGEGERPSRGPLKAAEGSPRKLEADSGQSKQGQKPLFHFFQGILGKVDSYCQLQPITLYFILPTSLLDSKKIK